MDTENFPLTTEQQTIAKSPYQYNQLVIAQPGTGKTHTVIARIEHLIESENLQPTELLVLCFSRAAVHEVISRLRERIDSKRISDDIRFVTVKTFDSFATRLLLASGSEDDLSKFDYDARIELAITKINSADSTAEKILNAYKHIIVDELQDIVGVRARLVQAILPRISGGFTLLGDPAQAIYGFSLQDSEEKINSLDLIKWVKNGNWVGDLCQLSLEKNFRSGNQKLLSLSEKLRPVILSDEIDGEEALGKITELINEFEETCKVDSPENLNLNSEYDSIRILCRTNGEVLQISNALSEKNVPNSIYSGSKKPELPPWLGRVFGTYTDNKISHAVFINRFKKMIDKPDQPDESSAWLWLKKIEGNQGEILDLKELKKKLRNGSSLPDDNCPYLDVPDLKISISTIHTSKGREFDHLIILNPEKIRNGNGTDLEEEARVYYVASTRAKEELSRMGRDGLPIMKLYQSLGDKKRWISFFRGSKFRFVEIGLDGDIDSQSYVNQYLFANEKDAIINQNYIWDRIYQNNASIEIKKQYRGKYRFFYIYHQNNTEVEKQLIGQMSLGFKYELSNLLRVLHDGGRFVYPNYIRGINVIAVVTELMPAYPENVHSSFRKSGFCLGIRIKGMGYLTKVD